MDKSTTGFLAELINTGSYEAYARESHEIWKRTKESQGWKYGPIKDSEQKTNPYMVDYEQLPADIKGQNSLTPYAVFNFVRTELGDKNVSELENILGTAIEGKNPELVDKLGEYVHSHFVAAQLAKGENAKKRADLCVYEALDEDTKSWDTAGAVAVAKYLLQKVRDR